MTFNLYVYQIIILITRSGCDEDYFLSEVEINLLFNHSRSLISSSEGFPSISFCLLCYSVKLSTFRDFEVLVFGSVKKPLLLFFTVSFDH